MITFSIIAAFVIVVQFDLTGPLEGDTVVQVSGDLKVPAIDVMNAITSFTTETGSSVVKIVVDRSDPERVRHFYVSSGDTTSAPAHWLTSGYPWFARGETTIVHPLSDLAGLDPRGDYICYGRNPDTLVEVLSSQGFHVATAPYHDPLRTTWWAVTQPIGTSLAIMTLLAMLLVAGGVFRDVKRYGIARLSGHSAFTILRLELRRIALVTSSGLAAVAILTGLLLEVYNHGHQLSEFALVAAGIACVLGACVLLSHLVCLSIAVRLDLRESIAGRLRSRWAVCSTYAIRLPAVVLTTATLVTALTLYGQSAAYDQSTTQWQSEPDLVTVNFNPNLSPDEQDRLAVVSGEWIAGEEKAGRAVLAQRVAVPAIFGADTSRALLVNDNYLSRHAIQGANGEAIATAGNGILVSLPASMKTRESEILAGVRELFGRAGDGVQVSVAFRVDGATTFAYGGTLANAGAAVMTDAVLIVTNSQSGLIRADDYMAYASQGGVLLTDATAAMASAKAYGADSFVLALSPAAQSAANRNQSLVQQFRVSATNLVLSAVVLLLTALALVALYLSRNAQSTFVRYTTGWGPWRMHRGLIAVEGALAALTVLLGVVLAAPDSSRPSGDWAGQSVAVLVLAALNAACVAVTLLVLTRRVVLTHSAEA